MYAVQLKALFNAECEVVDNANTFSLSYLEAQMMRNPLPNNLHKS